MDHFRIERIHLLIALGVVLLSWLLVSRDFFWGIGAGAVLGVLNLRMLMGCSRRLFAGLLGGGTRWALLFGFRFVFFAAAIGFAIASGIDPMGILIGFSTIVPAAIAGAWAERCEFAELAGKGSRV